MSVAATKDERVIQVYDLIKKELKRRGRNISFPKTADPRKTYTWRYIENFVGHLDELGLDDCVGMVVSAVVAQADEQKMLHRGVAILDHKDLLSACRVKLERELANEDNVLRAIQQSHFYLQKQATLAGTTPALVLTQKDNRFGYTNITAWYKSNFISLNYLVISRTCRKALGTLPKHELNLFPSSKELLRLRLQMLSNQPIMTQLRTILGGDIFEE